MPEDTSSTCEHRKLPGWSSLILTVRASAGVLAATLLLLLLAPESKDMMAGLWNGNEFWHWHAIAVNAVLILLGVSAWHWSRAALSARFKLSDTRRAHKDFAATRPPVDPIAFNLVPRLMFAAAAIVGAGLSLRSGTLSPQALARYPISSLVILLLWCGGLALLVFRLQLPRRLGGGDRSYAGNEHLAMPKWLRKCPEFLRELLKYAPLGPHFGAAMLLLAMIFFVLGAAGSLVTIAGTRAYIPLWIGQAFPGPGAALLNLGLAIAPMTALTFMADSWKAERPILGLVVRARWIPILALLGLVIWEMPTRFALHRVRTYQDNGAGHAAGVKPADRKHLSDVLDAWAESCPGTGPLRPVIVAVSGGASRAALWGARVLALADEKARKYHTGVFAVSSVSGGSVGAAAYMAWLAGLDNRSPCEELGDGQAPQAAVMKAALRADALGPLLAGSLFGDVPRALMASVLIPAHWVDKHIDGLPAGGDRAEALEVAFERNWTAALSIGPLPAHFQSIGFDRAYLSLNYDAGHTRTKMPIWIANGTDQQNGERLLTVPFRPVSSPIPAAGGEAAGWPFDGAKDVLGVVGADLPISTVIDNTCRFPLLSPVGELTPAPDADKPFVKHPMQIIDGGYFENEGLQTASELADWLAEQKTHDRDVVPILVQATADAADVPGQKMIDAEIPRCDDAFKDDPETGNGKRRADQLSAPVAGLIEVRGGHSGLVLREVANFYCGADKQHQRFFNFYLYRDYKHDLAVPLNWTLSANMADYIWDTAIGNQGNAAEAMALDQSLATPASGAH